MNTLIKALLLGGGAYLLYRTGILSSLTGGLIPASPGGPATGSSGPSAATPVGPPAFNSLAATGGRVFNAAVLDYTNGDRANQLSVNGGVPSATFDAWNYFLNKQTAFADLPDYSTLTAQPNPGVAMTFAQYWQLISPWLTANHGMSGLGEGPFVPADYIGSGMGDMGEVPFVPADYVGSGMGELGDIGMGQFLGLAGMVNSFYATPRNRSFNDPRMWGL